MEVKAVPIPEARAPSSAIENADPHTGEAETPERMSIPTSKEVIPQGEVGEGRLPNKDMILTESNYKKRHFTGALALSVAG